jgi:2,3-bisphosphoglycerate-dependent phosphoglycerate mutase
VATTLLLVRHAETDWNLERRWQGHADPPLNETVCAQARALALLLSGRGVTAVYSSDLARARATAELVARPAGLTVRLDPRLREVDVGEWSGLTTAEAEARFPAGAERRRAGGLGWEHGETYEAMGARVEEALLEIAAAHPGEAVLVVTHGGPVCAVRLSAGCTGEESHRVANCEVDSIVVREGLMRWLDSTRGGLHEQVQG